MTAIERSPGRGPARAVFFDAGFTLIFPSRPVEDLYVEAARAVSDAHCGETLRAAFHRAWAAGTRDEREDHRSSDAIERARWHRFTLRIAEAVPGLLPHHARWLEQLASAFDCGAGWKLDPGASGLLRALRERGLKVGIVSNWHAGLHRIAAEMGLDRMVDFVVCSASVGFRKPHPAIFEEALRLSGVAPAEALHVGDTWSEDVVGALAAGITPVHLARNPNGRHGAGHHTISVLDELAGLIDPAILGSPVIDVPRGAPMTSSMSDEKRTAGAIVPELKSVSHDVFNLMTVMYGLQETFQGLNVEDEAFSRALSDFNQVVTKMQQIGDRLLRLYREEGGGSAKTSKEDAAEKR